MATPSSYWTANAESETQRLNPSSPSWSGLAGTGTFSLDRRGRGERAKKRKLFGDSSSEEEEQEEPAGVDDPEEELTVLPAPTSYARVLLEAGPLKEFMESHIRCLKCGSSVSMKYSHLTLATTYAVRCNSGVCSFIAYSGTPQKASIPLPVGSNRIERNTDFAVNILYVLGFLTSGDGGKEASRLLGLLGLPRSTTMEGRSFPTIEHRIGPTLRELTDTLMLQNLEEEVEVTMKKEDNFSQGVFDLWRRSIDDASVDLPVNLYPRVTVSADFAWNTRGGGNAYNSNSGFGFLCGGEQRKTLCSIVKSKYCRLCSHGRDPRDHLCLKNHDGSSKSMEPVAIANMFLDLFDNFHVLVKTVVLDDDSTVRSRLTHTNEAWMQINNTDQPPRVYDAKGKSKKKPDNGALPPRVPQVPSFLADPNHRKKTLRTDLKKLANLTGGSNLTMTKCDAIRISHNYGYFVRALKNLDETEYKSAAQCVLDHHFGEHSECGPWCRQKTASAEAQQQSKKFYRDKQQDKKLYQKLHSMLFDKYFTLPRLRECAHGYDTQVNESLNNVVAWLAPKNKMYCASYSLTNRVAVAVGIVSLGLLEYHQQLFKALGIQMSDETLHFLTVKDGARARKQAKQKTKEAKLKRQEKKAASMKQDTATAKRERAQRMGTYGAGVGMEEQEEIDDGYDESLLTEEQLKIACKKCLRKGHRTSQSRYCKYYKPRNRKAAPPATAAAATDNDDRVNNDARDCARMDTLAFNDAVGDDDEYNESELLAELGLEEDPWGGQTSALI